MDTAELLDALTHYEALPEAAIREAAERRAEMVPLFVKAIEAFIADPAPPAKIADKLFLIVHMLGSWHEKSAYQCVARLLRCDPDRVDQVLGGAITETLGGIMLNLFDGDPRPLYDVVECETADEFVRSGMLEVLAALAERGDIAKDAFAAYLRQAFTTLQPQGESYIWVGWQSAIALLGLDELRDSVQQIFAREWVDPTVMDFDDFAEDMEQASRDPAHSRFDELRVRSFGDTIETLSKWYGFSEEYLAKRRAGIDENEDGLDQYGLDDIEQDDDFDPDEEYLPQEPVTNPFRHVGRNDPCPCGSGKKFKRCCLGKAA